MNHTIAERKVLGNMDSNFIVRLHYAFQTPGKLYFVMEYMAGGELFHHLRKAKRFTEEQTIFYAAEITLGIECLHKQNFIYRDLKPENVVLDVEGHVRLTDFGLSKEGVAFGSKKAYTFCGTYEYLAPEIIKGVGHDKAVDWWSLVHFITRIGYSNIRNAYRATSTQA